MALDVSALTAFNNEIAGELLPKIVYGGSTYKCEHCRKLYQIKSACERHEIRCKWKKQCGEAINCSQNHALARC